jgi:hypothetical protein
MCRSMSIALAALGTAMSCCSYESSVRTAGPAAQPTRAESELTVGVGTAAVTKTAQSAPEKMRA